MDLICKAYYAETIENAKNEMEAKFFFNYFCRYIHIKSNLYIFFFVHVTFRHKIMVVNIVISYLRGLRVCLQWSCNGVHIYNTTVADVFPLTFRSRKWNNQVYAGCLWSTYLMYSRQRKLLPTLFIIIYFVWCVYPLLFFWMRGVHNAYLWIK